MTLTTKTYHNIDNKMKYFSASQLKQWEKCEAATVAYIQGKYTPESSAAMLIGSYVDRALTAPKELDQWIAENKEQMKPAEIKAAIAMIERVKADETWKTIEKIARFQEILTGEIGGEQFCYMADICIHGKTPTLLDLKTTSSFDDDWAKDWDGKNVKVPWYDAWGYFRQLAIGQELWRQKHGETPACGLIAIKKPSKVGDPVGLKTIMMDCQERLDAEIRRIPQVVGRWQELKTGARHDAYHCGKCDWCLANSSLEEEFMAVSGRHCSG